MKRTIVSLSGGPDSAVALYEAKKESEEVLAVTFHYGAIADKEVEIARLIARRANVKHMVVDISFLGAWDMLKSSILSNADTSMPPKGSYESDIKAAKTTIVPFRNGIMLSILAGIAESKGYDTIVYGAHFSDAWMYPDCRKEFSEPMGKAIFEGTGAKVHLNHIFSGYTKAAVFALGKEYDIPLSVTWSCYRGERLQCGQCGSCIERQRAFKQAEIEDETKYIKPWSGESEKMRCKYCGATKSAEQHSACEHSNSAYEDIDDVLEPK